MNPISDYIPKGVIKDAPNKNENELLQYAKKYYLEHIREKRNGEDVIAHLMLKYKIIAPKSIDMLAGVMKLADVYYYYFHLLNATKSYSVFSFKTGSAYNKNNIKSLFSDKGLPIWNEEITSRPKLWICYEEDKNHIFLTFVSKTKSKSYFDAITQDFRYYSETGFISCRIHFDDKIIELAERNTSSVQRIEIIDFLRKKLSLNDISPISITDKDIRIFDDNVIQVTHEKREGEETNAYFTRANNKSDTRNDKARKLINDREFKKEHGVINISEEQTAIVALNKDKVGKVQFQRYLEPTFRLNAIHGIKNILGWNYE